MVRMAGEGDVASMTGAATETGVVLGGLGSPPTLGAVVELVGDPTRDEVRLPNRPESAATARRLAEAVLRQGWAAPATTAEHAVLLVSELVGNAVRHTGASTFGLRMHRRRGRLRVEVRDPSRGLPCLLPVTEMDTSGRGLWLVDRLADRWGVDLLPRGKSTWFEMRLPDPR
ncbi:ATP-binding protein [Streptomyces sp. RKND-216]|uniref:ATP-binding protein n=1 Tax=Streptomyces sp. RKND-216 TaxID=2562581 RepID=UPI001FF7AE05|nr:ATP-binding protein [Streptomyces sp. RKND-216]